jgi:hypothetical protein
MKHIIDRRTFIKGAVAVAVVGPVVVELPAPVTSPPPTSGLSCIVYDVHGNIVACVEKVVASLTRGSVDFTIPEIKIHNWETQPNGMKIAIVKSGQELASTQSPMMCSGDSLTITGFKLTLI